MVCFYAILELWNAEICAPLITPIVLVCSVLMTYASAMPRLHCVHKDFAQRLLVSLFIRVTSV